MNNILITGGTGKIGLQLVSAFALNGWNVITTSRNKKNISGLVDKKLLTEKEAEKIFVIEVDLMNEHAIRTVINYFNSHTDLTPTVLVNNARSLEHLSVEENGFSNRKNLLNEYLLDVIVPYELSTQIYSMPNSKLKSIINISSIYGVVAFNPNLYENYEKSAPIQYSLAKSAVNHLTRELSVRFAPEVRVNTVSYGGVEGRVDEKFMEKYSKLCPQGTMLTETQVAGPIEFLASNKSQGITGQNIIQDGGWTVW